MQKKTGFDTNMDEIAAQAAKKTFIQKYFFVLLAAIIFAVFALEIISLKLF